MGYEEDQTRRMAQEKAQCERSYGNAKDSQCEQTVGGSYGGPVRAATVEESMRSSIMNRLSYHEMMMRRYRALLRALPQDLSDEAARLIQQFVNQEGTRY